MDALTKDMVEQALQEARAELAKHHGNVEVLAVNQEGVVLVRLTGACSGCKSAPLTLRDVIEKSLKARLPQVTRVDALL
ncbi:nitrogen-fixing NifU domain protein [Desulfarculus baarsii DSM 2075]|uniref:Nitrogen-fixing NifU domain protein n=1 Tax=Desulfarculus baarsii (strain ATCC 33931 / DSM 2075 / LMG 7858 / VKM B-1802 / 2st14) TaxID=644282 RepID=E1QL03_DESB2|nr:NifU family protein [Desulfarculus baarsii]ADK85268.1 nitrogen-fixing NifU domain protein [Desulfarculus baarsii DSM 2075]